MSILDYFDDWKISATPRAYEIGGPDPITGIWEPGAVIDSTPIDGVQFNRTSGERYFSQTWADDITDVFVTDDVSNVSKDGFLMIDSVKWAVAGKPINHGEQDEAWSIGIKVIV